MKLLIKKIKVIDPFSPFHQSIVDILIQDGCIATISSDIDTGADKTYYGENNFISPGWVDVFSNFCDPGFEQKETIETGSKAAFCGGYTDVFIVPNTLPCIDNKSQIKYIIEKNKELPIKMHPIGSISKSNEGKDLAEIYDMFKSGAVAFSDGMFPVQSADFLLKALLYVKPIEGVIIQLPDDNKINPFGVMNEGVVSTKLGLMGKPSLSEELIVQRDIEICRYAESKIHFTGISCKKSVALIKKAKAEGVSVTCSVTPYHLLFNENDLLNYNTNLKVNPVIRAKEDQMALQEAIIDGTIDCIASHHFPHEKDSKQVEFEFSKFGISSIQTVFPMLCTAMPNLEHEKWVRLLSINPRSIFQLPAITLKDSSVACCTIFSSSEKSLFTEENFVSKSKNTPILNTELVGKVIGTINGLHINFNDNET